MYLKNWLYLIVVLGATGALLLLDVLTSIKLEILSTSVLLATTAGVFFLEGTVPYRRDWLGLHRYFWSDFRYTIIYFPIIIFFCQALTEAIPANLKSNVFFDQSLFVQFLSCFFFGELLFYIFHRLCHENALLWKLHRRHHCVRSVYWMNAGTFNLFDLLLNFLFYCLPAAIFHFHSEILGYVLFFSAVTGLMEHANIDFNGWPWNYIFNTAELHRWHHSADISQSKSNYGKALSLFDLLFGTFQYRPKEHVSRYGAD